MVVDVVVGKQMLEYYSVIVLKCSACYIEVQLVNIVVVVELKCMVNGMDREVCCVSVSSECSAA